MGDTKIEWATKTWNPVTGCTPVSPGCVNCYAKRMAGRYPQVHGFYNPLAAGIRPEPFSRVQFHPDRLDIPLRWKKPQRIFVCSMGDLFHEDVREEWIDEVIGTMYFRPQHTFMVLTKRPARMQRYMNGGNFDRRTWPIRNLWLGVTAENQAAADERIPLLLQTPAAVRFVSVEPMLGPVDLTRIDAREDGLGWSMHVDALHGGLWTGGGRSGQHTLKRRLDPLDWVICGGESGPGARAMYPEWARGLRDQCQAAGTRFFFKQWGEWGPVPIPWDVDEVEAAKPSGVSHWTEKWNGHTYVMHRIGKKAAGCLLDGREWKGVPV